MLFKAKSIVGRHVLAVDGDVGRVKDVYFDDATWQVRYFVVDTGHWLDRNEVLLAPSSFTRWEEGSDVIATPLTRKKVEDSPPVASDMPVSRQYEARLHEYYGWTPYWTFPIVPAPGLYMYPVAAATPPASDLPREVQDAELNARTQEGDPHLRSFTEIRGYHIKATDAEIGHVDDLLIDSEAFRVTHAIVDTRNWLPGKHVVVDVGVIQSINWEESTVAVSLSRQAVKDSPEYQPATPIDATYQERLSTYYRGIGDVTDPRVGV